MFSVNTNAGAFAALQNLNTTGRALDTTQSRINTGLKVSSARDDSAAYAIAQTMRGDVAGFKAVASSLDRAQSELDISLAAGEAISDLLVEMKQKAVSAKDSGLDDASRVSLNDDYQQLLSQIDTIANSASFNGRNLLTGGTLSTITDSTGSEAGIITASVTQLTTASLGLSGTSVSTAGSGAANTVVPSGSGNPWSSGDTLGALNSYMSTNFSAIYNGPAYNQSTGDFTNVGDAGTVGVQIQSDFGVTLGILASSGNFLHLSAGTLYTQGSGASASFTTDATSDGLADAAVTAVESAITTVNDALSELGSTANRLAIQQQFTGRLSDGVEVGIGNLVDADMAKESAQLQSLQTKQQLGLQALGIANQAPQTVLSLFR